MKNFQWHLWYVSEDLVIFAFFDDNVSFKTKRKMVHTLKNEETDGPLKRICVDSNVIHQKDL